MYYMSTGRWQWFVRVARVARSVEGEDASTRSWETVTLLTMVSRSRITDLSNETLRVGFRYLGGWSSPLTSAATKPFSGGHCWCRTHYAELRTVLMCSPKSLGGSRIRRIEVVVVIAKGSRWAPGGAKCLEGLSRRSGGLVACSQLARQSWEWTTSVDQVRGH